MGHVLMSQCTQTPQSTSKKHHPEVGAQSQGSHLLWMHLHATSDDTTIPGALTQYTYRVSLIIQTLKGVTGNRNWTAHIWIEVERFVLLRFWCSSGFFFFKSMKKVKKLLRKRNFMGIAEPLSEKLCLFQVFFQ